MGRARHVALMGKKRTVYGIMMESEVLVLLVRLRHMLEDNIKMDLK